MIATKMNKCQVCKRSNIKLLSRYSICIDCYKNPYRIEDLRHKLASSQKLTTLKKTYSLRFPEIFNPNTGSFWNKKFNQPSSLESQDEMTKDKISKISSLIDSSKKTRLLDLGIGKGYLEQFMNLKKEKFINIELFAIDISPKSIQDIKKIRPGTFYVGDVNTIDKVFKGKKFDVIVALELLEHIPPSQILSLLKRVHGLLQSNGIFLISIPTNEHVEEKQNNPSGHVRNYTFEIINSELLLAGFKVKKTFFLTAFEKNYKLKTFLRRIFPLVWERNNIVISASKSNHS